MRFFTACPPHIIGRPRGSTARTNPQRQHVTAQIIPQNGRTAVSVTGDLCNRAILGDFKVQPVRRKICRHSRTRFDHPHRHCKFHRLKDGFRLPHHILQLCRTAGINPCRPTRQARLNRVCSGLTCRKRQHPEQMTLQRTTPPFSPSTQTMRFCSPGKTMPVRAPPIGLALPSTLPICLACSPSCPQVAGRAADLQKQAACDAVDALMADLQ